MSHSRLSLVLGSVLLFTGLSMSADFYVAPSPKGAGDCSSQANACSLQTALSTAQSNSTDDTIFLEPGTYYLTPINEYLSDNGDSGSSLSIEPIDPSNKPVLTGSGLRIDTDQDGNGGDAGGDITISNLIFETRLWVKTRYGDIWVFNTSFRNSGLPFRIYGYSATTGFYNNSIANNSLNNGLGGVIDINTLNGTVYIYNNLFYGNSNPIGSGALYSFTNMGKVYIYNNTFFNNSGEQGGALKVRTLSDTSAEVYIYNNIFWNNLAGQGGNDGDDIFINSDFNSNGIGSNIQIFNNILGTNSDPVSGQSEDLYVSHTDKYTQGNNIMADPEFLNQTGNDLRISKDSPAVDAGTETIPGLMNFPQKDFRGEDRVKDGDEDNISTVDIGAYEYIKSLDVIISPSISGGGEGGCSSSPVNSLPVWSLVPAVLLFRRLLRVQVKTKS